MGSYGIIVMHVPYHEKDKTVRSRAKERETKTVTCFPREERKAKDRRPGFRKETVLIISTSFSTIQTLLFIRFESPYEAPRIGPISFFLLWIKSQQRVEYFCEFKNCNKFFVGHEPDTISPPIRTVSCYRRAIPETCAEPVYTREYIVFLTGTSKGDVKEKE